MKTVAYSDPYVPAEWIAAHGLRPRRVVPSAGAAGEGGTEGVCPWALAFARTVASDDDLDAAVFTTSCDQMRRVPEYVPGGGTRRFQMHVPATWHTPTARQLYVDELERMSRFLADLGGERPFAGKLSRTMAEFERKRAVLRDARHHLSAREYSEALARFNEGGGWQVPAAGGGRRPDGMSVALVGGPLVRDDFEIFDLVERAGGRVVLDATTGGERTMPASFEEQARAEGPLSALVDAYFGGIPAAFRRPNAMLYDWLERRMGERGVRGLILRRYAWCDTWHAEAARLEEWAPVPVLHLTAGAGEKVVGHAASRIEAFLEMLDG